MLGHSVVVATDKRGWILLRHAIRADCLPAVAKQASLVCARYRHSLLTMEPRSSIDNCATDLTSTFPSLLPIPPTKIPPKHPPCPTTKYLPNSHLRDLRREFVTCPLRGRNNSHSPYGSSILMPMHLELC